jgi:type II secretory pathway component PulF
VVILIAVAIVTGIMYFVIPKFQEIFNDFNVKLPALTLWLVSASCSRGLLYFFCCPGGSTTSAANINAAKSKLATPQTGIRLATIWPSAGELTYKGDFFCRSHHYRQRM